MSERDLASGPVVSVIVPSFNQGRFIGETIESILGQDYRPLEVLVVDGASTDSTLEVLDRFRDEPELRIVSEPDSGVVEAVNKGLARARGDILAIQSSDDLYLPGAVSAAVEMLEAEPNVALVYGDVEVIDAQSKRIGVHVSGPFDLRHYLGRFLYVPQPSAFFRRWVLRDIAGWREEVSYAADADFWIRIALQHPVRKIDRMMGQYRVHESQRDQQKPRIRTDWERSVASISGSGGVPRELRRFARMGTYLARYRYAPASAWARRTYYLYRAALANPGAVADRRFPKKELLPGRAPLMSLLSRFKRRLGFTPLRG